MIQGKTLQEGRGLNGVQVFGMKVVSYKDDIFSADSFDDNGKEGRKDNPDKKESASLKNRSFPHGASCQGCRILFQVQPHRGRLVPKLSNRSCASTRNLIP